MSVFAYPDSREKLLFLAKLAEQCGRYDEMLVCVKKIVVVSAGKLAPDEKDLLAVAYKAVISSRRQAFRDASALAQQIREAERGVPGGEAIKPWLVQLAAEMSQICADLFELLEKFLIPAAENNLALVRFLSLKADYCRYLLETGALCTEREKVMATASDTYARARTHAATLGPADATRLSLSLNHSVFEYETMGKKEQGFALAQDALDAVVEELPKLDDQQAEEVMGVATLLRQNIQNWAAELGLEDKDAQEEMQMEDA